MPTRKLFRTAPALAALLLLCAALVAPATAQTADPPPADPGPLICRDVDQGDGGSAPAEAVLDTVEVGTTWAGHYVGQALLTDGEDQYVGYYDENRELTVAHRTTDSAEWTHERLGSQTAWDSHNYITMATDPAGNLHVTGNMHNVPLLYWRTTTPGDVTSLERVENMADPQLEGRVTYPVFLELEDGTVIFRYREGGSGNGIDIYNEYDAETQTWQGLLDTPVLDGEGERNAYAAKPVLGPDGNYHMVWVWRETPIASSTHTVSYARSADLVNWETSRGEPMPLPITLGTSDVVDPVEPEGGSINNNVQVGFDAAGAPVVAFHKYDDGGNTQVYVARPDDSAAGWQTVQLSDWTGAWDFSQPGTLVFEVELYWAPELQPDGNLRLDVTCQGDARTFIIDAETLEPLREIATPPTEPDVVSELRSDYVHPDGDEAGTEMQVNLNDDSGSAGSFHARPLLPDADQDLRYLLRWESLGENQDLPRGTWPASQPIEVVALGTEDACRDGGWNAFDFASEAECVAHVQRETGTEPPEVPTDDPSDGATEEPPTEEPTEEPPTEDPTQPPGTDDPTDDADPTGDTDPTDDADPTTAPNDGAGPTAPDGDLPQTGITGLAAAAAALALLVAGGLLALRGGRRRALATDR
ncbi:BNR repeat-containing protein [Georgenia sp. MJ170]|uniref:BNR repeat-containing protein n=1 Tax=Georgenia sunbinii TaxID=3117728 RepID=UPI002F26DC4D